MKFYNDLNLVIIKPILPFFMLAEETMVTEPCKMKFCPIKSNRIDIKTRKQDLNIMHILVAHKNDVVLRVQTPS